MGCFDLPHSVAAQAAVDQACLEKAQAAVDQACLEKAQVAVERQVHGQHMLLWILFLFYYRKTYALICN